MWNACGTGEVRTEFWWGDLMEGGNFEDLRIDWKVILKWIFEKLGFGGFDWIGAARERDRWWAFVNAVMNIWVP